MVETGSNTTASATTHSCANSDFPVHYEFPEPAEMIAIRTGRQGRLYRLCSFLDAAAK
jgi:hypothetical protein